MTMNRASRVLAVVAASLLAAAVPLSAESGGPAAPAGTGMGIGQAIVLGLVEGVTEYLPVSSTGHLTVVEGLLGLWSTPQEKSAADAYAICIQAGAIVAVLFVSWKRIASMARGIVGRDAGGLRLFANLVVAAAPAGLIGFVLEERVKRYLFGLWPVAAAWLAGGLFILLVLGRRKGAEGTALEGLTWKTALVVGLAQVVAIWPGVSRSLVTIAAGLFLGLSVSAAVEWSFLLGLVTLGAATLYEGAKLGPEIVRTFGWVSPAVGVAVAAVAAFASVKWMVSYLRTRSLAIFGWYRIGIALVVAGLVLGGVLAA